MLEGEDVTFRWHADGAPVLTGLDFRIAEGEKIVLLGANGSGKSTLLKLINGLLFPQRGCIRYAGVALTKTTLAAGSPFARRFRRECALLFQHPEAMLFNATVKEEIAYTLRQLGAADADARALRWAEALGLVPLLEARPFHLSGGEKQKVALAAVLAVEPALLLLDEPSANLDPATVAWLIEHLLASRRTVIAATHNLSLAAELGDRCWVLSEGRLLFDGPVAAALADLALLEKARLAHRHRHRHGKRFHCHAHWHDWDVG